MAIPSIPTKGRTLDYAASVYDVLEPLFLFNKQDEFDNALIRSLAPQPSDAAWQSTPGGARWEARTGSTRSWS